MKWPHILNDLYYEITLFLSIFKYWQHLEILVAGTFQRELVVGSGIPQALIPEVVAVINQLSRQYMERP